MSEPLVSIITPCYNGEKYIDRYFNSILNQTYARIELIFINDGSTDNTEKIALSYSDALKEKGINFIYKYQENAGQAAALNLGLKSVTGEYMTWPDSDDIMTADAIEKKVAFLEQNPEYDIAICKIGEVKENSLNTIIKEHCRNESDDYKILEDVIFLRNVIVTPIAYIVKTKSLFKILIDKSIFIGKGGQNWQIIIPMLYYYKCGYINDILGFYVIRDDSDSHLKRKLSDLIEQNRNYEVLLMTVLKSVSDELFEKYEYQILRKYAFMRLYFSIDYSDVKYIRKDFLFLKKHNELTRRQILTYYVLKFPILYKILVHIREKL